MTQANFVTIEDMIDRWRDDVLTGHGPTIYPVGSGELSELQIGPGQVWLLGGAPGAGKTAFTMQLVTDGLRLTPDLRAVVCNVEMGANVLMDRQLARMSGIDLDSIRYRRFDERHADRLDRALNTLATIGDRLAFVRPPFDLANIAAAADEHEANLIVLDYIQRIRPPGEHGDKRGSVNATMDYLRQFADASKAIIVLSAVGRSRDDKGRSGYSGSSMSLASFRESSELEFGCDDAFILHAEGDATEGDTMRLRHLKSRYGQQRDILLRFDRPRMSFTPLAQNSSPRIPQRGRRSEPNRNESGGRQDPASTVSVALADLWNRTNSSPDDAAVEHNGDGE